MLVLRLLDSHLRMVHLVDATDLPWLRSHNRPTRIQTNLIHLIFVLRRLRQCLDLTCSTIERMLITLRYGVQFRMCLLLYSWRPEDRGLQWIRGQGCERGLSFPKRSDPLFTVMLVGYMLHGLIFVVETHNHNVLGGTTGLQVNWCKQFPNGSIWFVSTCN